MGWNITKNLYAGLVVSVHLSFGSISWSLKIILRYVFTTRGENSILFLYFMVCCLLTVHEGHSKAKVKRKHILLYYLCTCIRFWLVHICLVQWIASEFKKTSYLQSYLLLIFMIITLNPVAECCMRSMSFFFVLIIISGRSHRVAREGKSTATP